MGKRGPKVGPKGQQALRLRAEGLSLGAIAADLGVTRQRVSQFLLPEKHKARAELARALARGLVNRPNRCECGKEEPLDGHHDDYRRPLDVRWLCHDCHRRAHGHGPRVTGPSVTMGHCGMGLSDTPHSSFRLSQEGKGLLAKIAKSKGITMTAVLELLIRKEAGFVLGRHW